LTSFGWLLTLRLGGAAKGTLMRVVVRRAALALAASLVALPACSSGGGGQQANPATFGDAFEARVGPNGEVPLALALAAFTTAIGPLPGVSVKPLPNVGVFDGTLAVNALLAHWGELTEAQRKAASDLLVGPDGAFWKHAKIVAAGAPGSGPGRSVPRLRHANAYEDQLQADLVEAQRDIATRLGHPLGLRVGFDISPLTAESADAAAWTDLVDAAGHEVTSGRGTGCHITFTRPPPGTSAETVRHAAAHEMFHCFQFDIVGADVYRAAPWIVEGQATWAALTLHPSFRAASRWWNTWLKNHTIGLYQRAYDAVGFYAVLEHNAGIDPWSIFEAMLRARDNDAALAAATGGAGPEFVSVIAMAITREPALGPPWESRGPLITSTRYTRHLDVAPGAPALRATDTVKARSAQGYELSLGGDVLEVQTNAPFGAIGFPGTPGQRFTSPLNNRFCLRPGGCTCPGGRQPDGPPLAIGARGTGALAVGAPPAGLEVVTRLKTETLQDACRQAPASALARCLVGHWHLVRQDFVTPPPGGTYTGGTGGRRLVLTGDAFDLTDDGSDPLHSTSNIAGAGPVTTNVTVVAHETGTITVAGSVIHFDARSVDGTAHVSTTVSGQTIQQDLPLASLGVGIGDAYSFTGDASYTCRGPSLTLRFPLVTFVLGRGN